MLKEAMKPLTLNFPDDLDFDSKEMTLFLAAKLYEDGKLSLGKAAQTAGMSYRDFMDALSSFGVSIFNYPAEDLDRDLASIEHRRS
jgi:predicted HTH domain antitoxin